MTSESSKEARMPGGNDGQGAVFSYISPEASVPKDQRSARDSSLPSAPQESDLALLGAADFGSVTPCSSQWTRAPMASTTSMVPTASLTTSPSTIA
jgi:hypothetical protein